jgi:hypothetical protein
VIHGGVDLTNRFVFASEREVIAQEWEQVGVDIIVAGHAGVPFIEKVGRGAWFNPGVIGMPANDGTPDVWYGLIGLEAGDLLLSTRRLAYDHLSAAAAMALATLGNYARSRHRVWPSLDVFPPRAPRRAGPAPAHRADPCSDRTSDGGRSKRLRGHASGPSLRQHGAARISGGLCVELSHARRTRHRTGSELSRTTRCFECPPTAPRTPAVTARSRCYV